MKKVKGDTMFERYSNMDKKDQGSALKLFVGCALVAAALLWAYWPEAKDRNTYAEFKYHTFEEKDLMLDKKTEKYRKIILKGVNTAHREIDGCKTIDPLSAYTTKQYGDASDPVFFVTCGYQKDAFSLYFYFDENGKMQTWR